MKLFRKRIDWSDFILEVLSIIIGISVAFWVEDWRQDRADHELELNWLTELKHDLNDTKKKLDILIEKDSSKIAGIEVFKYKIYESDSEHVHISSGFELYWTWLDAFRPSLSTFEVIKASGNTKVFQDQNILLDLYRIHSDFSDLEMFTNHETEEIRKWVDPIIYNHFDAEILMDQNKKFKVNRKEISEIPMLRNQVFLFRGSYINQMKFSKYIKIKVEQLIGKIDKQISDLKK